MRYLHLMLYLKKIEKNDFPFNLRVFTPIVCPTPPFLYHHHSSRFHLASRVGSKPAACCWDSSFGPVYVFLIVIFPPIPSFYSFSCTGKFLAFLSLCRCLLLPSFSPFSSILHSLVSLSFFSPFLLDKLKEGGTKTRKKTSHRNQNEEEEPIRCPLAKSHRGCCVIVASKVETRDTGQAVLTPLPSPEPKTVKTTTSGKSDKYIVDYGGLVCSFSFPFLARDTWIDNDLVSDKQRGTLAEEAPERKKKQPMGRHKIYT